MNNQTTKQTLEKILKLGQSIARKRRERNFTQNEFAEIIDISREHLAKIETAKRSVSLDLLINIADKLNTKVKDLIDF